MTNNEAIYAIKKLKSSCIFCPFTNTCTSECRMYDLKATVIEALSKESQPVFSDYEHRLLLGAVSKEMSLCEKEYPELIPIVKSIENKIHKLQHRRK